MSARFQQPCRRSSAGVEASKRMWFEILEAPIPDLAKVPALVPDVTVASQLSRLADEKALHRYFSSCIMCAGGGRAGGRRPALER
jgi:hypothetical protein